MDAFFSGVSLLLSSLKWNDIIDILIVTYILYKLFIFVRESRTQLIVKGILIIVVAYALATLLRLTMVSYIINIIVRNAAIAMIVVFQPEIRNMLERVGRSKLSSSVRMLFGKDDDAEKRSETLSTISNVVECARILQKQCMGALIVFERSVMLSDIINSGTVVDAAPHYAVLSNIFFNKAPLHDGAVVIRNNRICAAGCILPLTQQSGLDSNLGTRHRAGIGMSEHSDAVVVIVSEESGRLSVAYNGKLISSFDPADLSSALIEHLLPEDTASVYEDKPIASFAGKIISKFRNGKKSAVKEDGDSERK
ncbi:MAG: diadenylate cyclase CdaA [Clostridia bacterium]|nr:diadenylate cyclase CdaA [Clostridia bacterium]